MTTTVERDVVPESQRAQRGDLVAPANLQLGEILVATGAVSASQLAAALARKRLTGRRLGEELVAAGHLPGHRLAPALTLQRRLAIAALCSALIPAARDADAAQTRAYLAVSATIVDTVSIRALYQAASLIVTAQDIERGYVDVPAGSRFEIRNKGACLFEFRPVADIFKSVTVSGVDGAAELGAGGGTLLQRPGGGAVGVSYRFALASGLRPASTAGRSRSPCCRCKRRQKSSVTTIESV